MFIATIVAERWFYDVPNLGGESLKIFMDAEISLNVYPRDKQTCMEM